jgi:hypothetical protein
MPKTVVGLFENAQIVDDAVREIEALGFPRQEVRTMREPANFDVTGVMSFPRLDFEVDLNRELTRIGATIPEAQAYVEGLRRGGALAFATGPDEKVDAAGNIMNRLGAMEVEEILLVPSRCWPVWVTKHDTNGRWPRSWPDAFGNRAAAPVFLCGNPHHS